MRDADAYQKAAAIADQLLARGYPVREYEAHADMMIFRFGGDRAQTIHADAAGATFESICAAYHREPPDAA